MEMQVNVELKERREGATVILVANLSYPRGGRLWHSTVSGQGASRADAVEDLAKRRLNAALRPMLLAKLDEMDVQQATTAEVPKAPEPSAESAVDGQDKPVTSDNSPVSESLPQSGPIATTSPTSEPADSPKSKPTETSQKPAGTQPEQLSAQASEAAAEGEGKAEEDEF